MKKKIRIYADKQDCMNDGMTTVQHEVNHSLDHSTNSSIVNEPNQAISQSTSSNNLGLSSALGLFSPEIHGENEDEYIRRDEEKKKKRRRGLGR